jgi:hypothetical protein
MFTFLAIAYSTTRAATQTKALSGKKLASATGPIRLDTETDDDNHAELVTSQPPKAKKMDSMRYQALLSAVEDGYAWLARSCCLQMILDARLKKVRHQLMLIFVPYALSSRCRVLPASAIQEYEDEEARGSGNPEDEVDTGIERDDEKTGTKYSVRLLLSLSPRILNSRYWMES